ncbi:MAG: PSD1 and planctomycete cytochrome C domain-containing protein, partial [Cyclobacteriaceae bacterium]|nr:PSD1 and planctomycete cytochrome C domain-containing protein [Cyclobacteriaceae bacterium]
MTRKRILYGIAGLALALLTYYSFTRPGTLPKSDISYNYHVRPILTTKCLVCHGPDSSTREAGLRLDIPEGATALLESGHRAIVPGNVKESALFHRIHADNEEEVMPPPETKKTLTAREKSILEEWIASGARYEPHWAFIKPAPFEPSRSVDDFIKEALAEQEIEGLAPRASGEAIIRRLSYLLTGLPPTSDQLSSWLGDQGEEAYERMVDDMLASPHFGERWARHWMDLVRYSETKGHEFDYPIKGAWQYRDYLIRAFNEDVPYDRLVREHLSGDLMEKPRTNEEGLNESVLATAFFNFSEGKHSPVSTRMEEANGFDNIIDVTTKTFQSMTLACARCHDHKFDPLPTKDYYALYGILESSRATPRVNLPLPLVEKVTGQHDSLFTLLTSLLEEPARPIPVLEKEGFTREGVSILGDFSGNDFQGWFTDGPAFGEAPRGFAPLIDTISHKIVKYEYTGATSRYYGKGIFGALRSPTFTIEKDNILVKARGEMADIRIIINNFQLIQAPIYGGLEQRVNTGSYKEYLFDLSPWKGEKAYVEILSGKYDRHNFNITPETWVDVDLVIAFEGEKPVLPNRRDVPVHKNLTVGMAGLYQSMAHLARKLQSDNFFLSVTEGTGINSPVFTRGKYQNPTSEKVSRGFLSVLPEVKVSGGSGRKQLAEIILHPDNPLTARVMVNRIWHHLFGRGLVETVDNFGLQGKMPSHPALLDYLAGSFVENGWSVKKLIRQIVLSETFRQSTRREPSLEAVDPENIWLASYPVRRLEAEAIRDAILTVAGSLDRTLYGPSVPVHLSEFMQGRGRPGKSGPLDGNGRRSVYLEVRRNFLSPFMLAFDTPPPVSTFGSRNATNVPAQSLTLMNDAF